MVSGSSSALTCSTPDGDEAEKLGMGGNASRFEGENKEVKAAGRSGTSVKPS